MNTCLFCPAEPSSLRSKADRVNHSSLVLGKGSCPFVKFGLKLLINLHLWNASRCSKILKVGLKHGGKQIEQREKQKRTKPDSKLSSAPVSYAGNPGRFFGGVTQVQLRETKSPFLLHRLVEDVICMISMQLLFPNPCLSRTKEQPPPEVSQCLSHSPSCMIQSLVRGRRMLLGCSRAEN